MHRGGADHVMSMSDILGSSMLRSVPKRKTQGHTSSPKKPAYTQGAYRNHQHHYRGSSGTNIPASHYPTHHRTYYPGHRTRQPQSAQHVKAGGPTPALSGREPILLFTTVFTLRLPLAAKKISTSVPRLLPYNSTSQQGQHVLELGQ